ncbi:MAG: peptidase domain-containing ABC transporter [Alkalilacustris sp.]
MTASADTPVLPPPPAEGRADLPRLPGRAGGIAAIVLASVGINLLSLALPLAILQLYDRIIPAEALETLVVLLIGVAFALMLEALLSGVRATLIAWSAARQEHALSGQMFARLLAADPLALRAPGPGGLAERFAAVSRIKDFQGGQALAVLADLPFALLFLGIVWAIGGWIAAIPLAIVGLFAACLALGDAARARHLHEADALRTRQLSFFLEALGRIGAVKALGLEALMTRRFERLQRGLTRIEQTVAHAAVSGQVLQAALGGVTLVAVAAGGSLGVIASTLTMGELAACTLLANRALQPMQRVMGMWSGFRQQALQRRHVAAGLAMPSLRRPDAPPLPPLQGAIRLEDVSVAGEGEGPMVLDRLSLGVAAGECIGITGAAGCGKTTLLSVMAGLRCPDGGRVRIDGFDLWHHAEASREGQVVLVSSRAPVFAGTLMENMTGFAIGPGRAGHPGDRTRALDLAERLGLAEFAGRLPAGYDTMVGPGSAFALPPGIAQRLALVRALQGQPKVLLFDAANTALDSTADALVRAVLVAHQGMCTQVIVSQRPSLLAIAQRVFLLAGGRLQRIEARAAADTVVTGPRPA